MTDRPSHFHPPEVSARDMSRWVKEPYPDYVREVNESIRFSGINVDFFTAGKADWIRKELASANREGVFLHALDIGCGIGSIHPHLIGFVDQLTGADVSLDALRIARVANPLARYSLYDGRLLPFPEGCFDLAFAICVMHHVPPPQWPEFVSEAYRVLKPGGTMLVFEHNPLNPLTRIAVNRCEFDSGAVLLSARKVARLMRGSGFTDVRSRFIFFTPFQHPAARWLDAKLGFLWLGAQHYTSGMRPHSRCPDAS